MCQQGDLACDSCECYKNLAGKAPIGSCPYTDFKLSAGNANAPFAACSAANNAVGGAV